VIFNLLSISLVPRHSFKPESLYLDLQKLRRASLITASETFCPDSGLYCPASIRSATFTYFIAGPLGCIISNPDDRLAPGERSLPQAYASQAFIRYPKNYTT
jgi:hypothetical protein